MSINIKNILRRVRKNVIKLDESFGMYYETEQDKPEESDAPKLPEPGDESKPKDEPVADIPEPIEEPIEEPTEEPIEEPIEEPMEEPMEEPKEEPKAKTSLTRQDKKDIRSWIKNTDMQRISNQDFVKDVLSSEGKENIDKDVAYKYVLQMTNKLYNDYLKRKMKIKESMDSNIYYTIVFLQGHDTEEFEKILKEKGEAEAMNYLSQWDYGSESLIDGSPNQPWGNNETTYIEGDYIMAYDTAYETAGLYFKEGQDRLEESKHKKINENVKEKTKNTIDKWISEFGARETAVKIIDSILMQKLGGLSSSDLPDTATFASGLDDMEEFLNSGDYRTAIDIGKETARDMLEEEGFDDY